MKKTLLFILLITAFCSSFAKRNEENARQDTLAVIKLNKLGFSTRKISPAQTVQNAERALALAIKLNYPEGIGESYRIMGVGNYYLNQPEKANQNYLTAIDYFVKANDLTSEAAVYNNIGNLYLDNDYDQSLDYFQKSLVIATKLGSKQLIAKINFNIGNVYCRMNSYTKALTYYDNCQSLFIALNDSSNLVECLKNKGVVYYNLNQFSKAEQLLTEANKKAIAFDQLETVASIDLTIAELFIAQNKFPQAETAITEGLTYSHIIKDQKIQADFEYTRYQLELKRKNYKKALFYLIDIHKQDSTTFKKNSSTQINLIREQFNQQARQRATEILMQRQKYDRVRFWAVTVVAGLLLVLVGLLISNVKRKAQTNTQLTDLNAEISRQKDNLDRINHHLEEIIDERTKDLQVKNKKLSDYSSYLSHQIRGPIATLKGLLNLEKEGLVDEAECIRMMNKSVSEIDDKIIEMSDMLHDPGRQGF